MIERKMLSLETTALLDKLYNFRGEDSTILIEMDRKRQSALESKERTSKEKDELQAKITDLEAENNELNKQGEQLGIVLAGINRDDFKTVLDRLSIDFEPTLIKETLDKKLPETINAISEEINAAKDKLKDVEEEASLAETTIEEISLKRDAEIVNQKRLNEYFDMALSGNINITRDQIIDLLLQFDLDQEEAREAAKLLMFPEDALFEYDRRYNEDTSGKSIKEVIKEANDNVLDEPKEEKEEPIFSNEEYELENTNSFVVEDFNDTDVNEDSDVIVLDENDDASDSDLAQTITLELEKKELDRENSKQSMRDLLNEAGIDYLDIDQFALEELENKFDENVFKNNINTLKELGIDLDILTENPVLFYDQELKDKIDLLMNNGKEALDIYFNARVLIKYNYNELKEAINRIKEKGLEPREVPLMAY